MLVVRDLVKAFGGARAVDGVSFEIREGVIAGLIGPNGAGKTTLFNCLAGVYRPEAGEIVLDGAPIHGLSPDRIFDRGLARTFQIPRPFPEMTVLDNVLVAPRGQAGERFLDVWLKPGEVARQERANREKARHWLDFVGLSRLEDEPARVLSGGQRKLLELARVLVADPRLILLDEPGAGVNPKLLDAIVDRIVELNRQGRTFLVIEHNMDLVMSLCSPIMVMAEGRLILTGEAADVRSDPRVVEAYLGGAPA